MTDKNLWDLIGKNEKGAFEQLYRRYYSPLLAYAIRLQFDENTAKDCIQDIFVRIYIKRYSLPEITYIKSYLYRCMINALLDKIKSSQNNNRVPEEELLDICIEDAGLMQLFEMNDEDMLMARQLKKAYTQLSCKQKNAIYFYYIQEFSWEEIADIFNMSPHSCMNLVARAVAKLRSLIRE